MRLEEAHFRHYRNYAQLDLTPSRHSNLFIGENASGKSNILEAIYFLSHGKSYRTRQDRDLIQWDNPFATIKLVASSHIHGGVVSLEAQLSITSHNTLKSVFKINGNPVRSRSEIVGRIPSVTFFLSDLAMLRGAPEDRRNALDSALVQFDPAHFKRLSAYHRVRQQKSQVLKNGPGHVDPMLLQSLNQQLTQTGAQVISARMMYLSQVETLAQLRYHELCHGREVLTNQYQASFSMGGEYSSVAAIEQAFAEAIQHCQTEEQRRGQVLVGPHRDDIRFYLNERDAGQFGSQGQQRTIVLAFKLAEIEILSQKLQSEMPLLLLDDVMAELDPSRQRQLLSHLDPRMQVFLTTTHLDSGLKWFLESAESVKIFQVNQGRVTLEESGLVSHGVSHNG